MRFRYLHLVFAVAVTSVASAQQTPVRATRADGGAVILFPNGTWRPDSTASSTTVIVNGGTYTTPASSTTVLDLGRGVTLHYDPAKWQQAPSTMPGRLQFRRVDGDGYAMVISERLSVPVSSLKNIVLTNARNAAPDAAITMEEQRRVNGVNVEVLQFKATTQGIPFKFYGYYFAGKPGTIQVTTYSGESLFDEMKPDFDNLLNGLQISEP